MEAGGENGERRRSLENFDWFDTREEYLRYLRIIEALEINIVSEFDDGESDQLDFTWRLVNFQLQSLEIQLYFEQPEIVS